MTAARLWGDLRELRSRKRLRKQRGKGFGQKKGAEKNRAKEKEERARGI